MWKATTTSFLSQLLSQTDIKVTRLASGPPVGGDLEYADEITLGRAWRASRGLTSYSPHPLHWAYADDCANVARAIWKTRAETSCTKNARRICESHIVPACWAFCRDKSDFSIIDQLLSMLAGNTLKKIG